MIPGNPIHSEIQPDKHRLQFLKCYPPGREFIFYADQSLTANGQIIGKVALDFTPDKTTPRNHFPWQASSNCEVQTPTSAKGRSTGGLQAAAREWMNSAISRALSGYQVRGSLYPEVPRGGPGRTSSLSHTPTVPCALSSAHWSAVRDWSQKQRQPMPTVYAGLVTFRGSSRQPIS